MKFEMSLDIKKFHKSLTDNGIKLKVGYTRMYRKALLDIFRDIVELTPVDTGALRSAWSVGVSVIPGNAKPEVKEGSRVRPSTAKNMAMKKGREGLRLAKWDKDVYISNHTHYAGVIENGHSKQAPDGMVKPVLNDWENKLARAFKQMVKE